LLKKEDVPEEYILKQKDIFLAQMKDTKKSEASWAKIVEGKSSKHLAEICLIDQESIVQKGKTIEQLRIELAVKCEENISIRRFSRWELGEGINKSEKKI
jgi:elongation factor Ts